MTLTLTLRGRVVTLEPLRVEHADRLWPAADDDAIRAYWPMPLRTLEEMRAQCSHLLAIPSSHPYLIRTTDGRAAGQTCLYAIDPDHRSATIGWTFITAPYRRTAVNTETKLLMLTRAFEERGLERVQFDVDARNTLSQQALERIGAMREGVLRKHKVLWDGFVRDTVVFSIVKDEWPAVQAGLEAKMTR